ncbi:MAG TPA: hypothetical protein GXX20_04415 [Clostridiaceae bacterium]|nr:hypothetical protein [Clostridiaceae bacterium]
MPKEIMTRKASDNEYLHKDFHLAMNTGIDYLHKKYGEHAVREYLKRFAKNFYAPLTEALKTRGLVALKEHFEHIYKVERSNANITLKDDELTISVDICPAVEYIRKNNAKVADLFYETTKTVNETICEGTPYAFELIEYNQETGGGTQRFYRR